MAFRANPVSSRIESAASISAAGVLRPRAALSRDGGTVRLMPGYTTVEVDKRTEFQKPQVNAVHISELPDYFRHEVRDEVMAATMRATQGLMKYYDLAWTTLPCVVLVEALNPVPYVIETKTAASAESLMLFLRDLRKLVEPYLSRPRDLKLHAGATVRDAHVNHAKTQLRLESAIKTWHAHLVQVGVREEALTQAWPSRDGSAFEDIAGVNGPERMPASLRMYASIILDAATITRYRQITQRVTKKIANVRHSAELVKLAERRRDARLRMVEHLESTVVQMAALRRELLKVVAAYRRRLVIRHTFRVFARLVERLVGVSKLSKDMADIRSAIAGLRRD